MNSKLLLALLAALIATVAAPTLAQKSFPVKPIRIVTSEPGGGSDFVTRLIIQGIGGHIRTGRLTGLAVTSAKPSALAPGYPTIASAGLPGYESVSMYGIYAPPKTPRPIIDLLNKEIVQALRKPEIKDRLFAAGTEVVASTPEELAAKAKSEIARVGQVIKAAGIRGN